MTSEHEQRDAAYLDGEGVGDPVHRELGLVLGVEDEETDLVLLDQALVVLDLVTHLDDRAADADASATEASGRS